MQEALDRYEYDSPPFEIPECFRKRKIKNLSVNKNYELKMPKQNKNVNKKELREKAKKFLPEIKLNGGMNNLTRGAIPPHLAISNASWNPILNWINKQFIIPQKHKSRKLGVSEYFYQIMNPSLQFENNEFNMNKAAVIAHHLAQHANYNTHKQMFIQPGTKLQFVFECPDSDKDHYSTAVDATDPLSALGGSFFGGLSLMGSDNFGGTLKGIRILVNDLFRGGCSNVPNVQVENYGDYKIKSMKSKDNNCGIACLYSVVSKKKKKERKYNYNQIRLHCGIPRNIKLNTQHLRDVSDFLKVGFRLYTIEGSCLKPIEDYNYHLKHIVNILFNPVIEHYSVLILLNKKSVCVLCGRQVRNMKKHKCNPNMISFYQKNKMADKNNIAMFKDCIKNTKPFDLNHVYVFDLETFPNSKGMHQIYACMLQNVGNSEEPTKLRWGEYEDHLQDIYQISTQGQHVDYYDNNPGEEQGYFVYTNKDNKNKKMYYKPFKSQQQAIQEAQSKILCYVSMKHGFISHYTTKIDQANCKVQILKDKETLVDYVAYDINDLKTKSKIEEKLKNKMLFEEFIFVAHNLARFDGMFLMNYLIAKGVEVDMTINSGRIISLKWNNSRVWDTCLFMPKSLKAIAKDFGCKVQKADFDHKLIKSWDDVILYENEVITNEIDTEASSELVALGGGLGTGLNLSYKKLLGWKPYLRCDVMSLKEIVERYATEVYQNFKVDCFDFCTLSSMSYNIWGATTIKEKYMIEIPQDLQYDFIKDAIYGGRVFPMIKNFQSKKNLDLNEQIMLEEIACDLDAGLDQTQLYNKYDKQQLIELYNKIFESDDFISNQDMNSLYPTAMCMFEYPVGIGEWSTTPKQDYEQGHLGLYEIEFIPPNNLVMAILPQRNKPYFSQSENPDLNKQWKASGIKWSLEPGSGIYTNIDIALAIEYGYKIIFKSKAFIWRLKGYLFKEYIEKIYQMKKEQDLLKQSTGEYNEVKRMIAKDMMNSLYGKCCQKPIKDKHSIINSEQDFYKFVEQYNIKDWQLLNKDDYEKECIFLKGGVEDVENNKPQHLGCFILAYSRHIMTEFFSKVTNQFSACNFSYTDTDSIHMKGFIYKYLKLMDSEMFGDEMKQMKNDLKDPSGIIFKEICLAPKNYTYFYINSNGTVGQTKKIKGIPYKAMNEIKLEHFESEETVEITYESWKRHILDEHAFEIEVLDCTRTFLQSKFDKLEYYEHLGEWRPFGYVETVEDILNDSLEIDLINAVEESIIQAEPELDEFNFKIFKGVPGVSKVKWFYKLEPALYLPGTRLVKLHEGNKFVNHHLFSKLELKDILTYLNYVKDKNSGCMQEIIQNICKLYCDVDFKVKHRKEYNEDEILEEIIQCILEASKNFDVPLNPENLKITNCCTSDKFSWHIICGTEIFAKQQYQKEFWNHVNQVALDQFPNLVVDAESRLTCFDLSIYGNHRCIRTIFSKKPGGDIFKPVDLKNVWINEFDPEFKIEDYLIVPEVSEIRSYSKLSKECAQTRIKNTYKPGSKNVLNSSTNFPEDIKNLLVGNQDVLNGYNLEKGTWNQDYIRLTRIQASECIICKREHEKDNAYIVRLSKALVCYRDPNQKFYLK